MSAYNPHFENSRRAATELPELIQKLGAPNYSAPLTEDQIQIADAIQSHADTALDAITGGLAAIGQMMSFVAHSNDELDSHQLAGLGDLIKHLAVEMQSLRDIEASMHVRLEQSSFATAAAAKPARGARSRPVRNGGAPV